MGFPRQFIYHYQSVTNWKSCQRGCSTFPQAIPSPWMWFTCLCKQNNRSKGLLLVSNQTWCVFHLFQLCYRVIHEINISSLYPSTLGGVLAWGSLEPNEFPPHDIKGRTFWHRRKNGHSNPGVTKIYDHRGANASIVHQINNEQALMRRTISPADDHTDRGSYQGRKQTNNVKQD